MEEAANPVLVEVTRGDMVESRHRGAIAIVGPDGARLLAFGDVREPVFPRSAIKLLQAIPLVATGAADRFGVSDGELALACGSHAGSAAHVALASGMLAKAGLGEEALRCGAHRPLDGRAAARLVETRQKPGPLHNNCSGKHAGMLLQAKHLGEDLAGYGLADHPVQRRIADVLATLTGEAVSNRLSGIDGCGVPTWAIPLEGQARAFQRLVSGETHPLAVPAGRLLAACWRHPEAVAGEGRLDTIVMRRNPGVVFLKTGAEGVYCAAVRGRAVGIALKIDDGAKRAAELAIMAALERLGPAADVRHPDCVIRNCNGKPVGEIRLAEAFRRFLDGV